MNKSVKLEKLEKLFKILVVISIVFSTFIISTPFILKAEETQENEYTESPYQVLYIKFDEDTKILYYDFLNTDASYSYSVATSADSRFVWSNFFTSYNSTHGTSYTVADVTQVLWTGNAYVYSSNGRPGFIGYYLFNGFTNCTYIDMYGLSDLSVVGSDTAVPRWILSYNHWNYFFGDCHKLEKIDLRYWYMDQYYTLGNRIFYHCYSLKELHWPMYRFNNNSPSVSNYNVSASSIFGQTSADIGDNIISTEITVYIHNSLSYGTTPDMVRQLFYGNSPKNVTVLFDRDPGNKLDLTQFASANSRIEKITSNYELYQGQGTVLNAFSNSPNLVGPGGTFSALGASSTNATFDKYIYEYVPPVDNPDDLYPDNDGNVVVPVITPVTPESDDMSGYEGLTFAQTIEKWATNLEASSEDWQQKWEDTFRDYESVISSNLTIWFGYFDTGASYFSGVGQFGEVWLPSYASIIDGAIDNIPLLQILFYTACGVSALGIIFGGLA